MSDMTITDEDVASFRDKLDTWATTLSESEQAILQMVAVRAFPDSVRAPSDSDEVTGYTGPGVFEIEDYSFDIEQVLNIGSQSSGAGAGKVTFNPFTIGGKHGFRGGTVESLVGITFHKP